MTGDGWRDGHARLAERIAALPALDTIATIHRSTRRQHERADRLLLHLFQHQTHHRGQAHAMLSGTSIPPPQLDEFFSHGEAPLARIEVYPR